MWVCIGATGASSSSHIKLDKEFLKGKTEDTLEQSLTRNGVFCIFHLVLLCSFLFCFCLLTEIVESGSCFCLGSQMRTFQLGEDSGLVNESDSSCLCVCMQRKQWLDFACPVLIFSVSLSNSVFSLRLLQLCCRGWWKGFLGNSDVKQLKCTTHLVFVFPLVPGWFNSFE